MTALLGKRATWDRGHPGTEGNLPSKPGTEGNLALPGTEGILALPGIEDILSSYQEERFCSRAGSPRSQGNNNG